MMLIKASYVMQLCGTIDVNGNGSNEDNVDISEVPWNFCLRLYAQIYQNRLHIAYVHFDSKYTI